MGGVSACAGGQGRRMPVVAVITGILLGLGAMWSAAGCGDPVRSGASGGVFQDLAMMVAPMPVYGWTEMPGGLTLLPAWLPVIDQADPAEYSGPAAGNPRVVGDPAREPEVQVVFSRDGGGWVVVVENFRGDLGDVSGTNAGAISGHPATMYSVNGGYLLQWSDGGRWYGLFGRNTAEEDVLALALAIALVPDVSSVP